MDEAKDGITKGISEQDGTHTTEQAQPRRGFLHETFEVLKILFISLAIVLPIRYFIVQPFIVRGASMDPTYRDGQYLIIDELSYDFRNPARGEVIVFHYPKDPSQFFIKRIIALPGERIQIAKGRVTIFNETNPKGMLLDESYLTPPHHATYPDKDMTLSQTEYFLMGDNRDFSSDSRYWGPMDMKFMVGRTMFRAWPFDVAGFLNK